MVDIFSSFSMSSAIDIFFMSVILYQLLLFVRGTRTQQILIGILILISISLTASYFELELHTINWVINKFYSSFIIVIVILFQHDIRRMLSRVGKTQLFGNVTDMTHDMIEEIVDAAQILSQKKVGAIIAIERENNLRKYVEIGRPIDAAITADLIRTIFNISAPLHDGAIIIQSGKINAASCFLPLTRNPYIDAKVGSRHRAALGLAEETDAVVIVVSEETGGVSFVIDGEMNQDISPSFLRKSLTMALRKKAGSGEKKSKISD